MKRKRLSPKRSTVKKKVLLPSTLKKNPAILDNFKAIVDNANDGILIADAKGRYLYANKCIGRITGYSAKKLRELNIKNLIHPKEFKKVSKHHSKRIEGQIVPHRYETVLIGRNGKSIQVELTAVKISWQGYSATLAIIRDISTQKTIEEELRSSRDYLDSVLNSVHEGLVIVDKNLVIRDVNNCFCEQYELSRKKIIGKHCYEITHGFKKQCSKKSHICPVKQVFYSGLPVSKEHVHVDVKGNKRIIEVRAFPVTGHKGKVEFAVELLRDVTEVKESENLLRKEKEWAQNYLDVAGVMIVAIDNKGKVLLINKKGCEILRYKEHQIIGLNWFDNFLPKRLRNRVKLVHKKLRQGKIKPIEYFENPVLTKGGKEKLIAWHNSVLRGEKGKIVGSLSSGEDITLRKQAQQQLKIFKKFAESSSLGHGFSNLDGNIIYANEKLLEMLDEKRPENILGKNVTSYYPNDVRSMLVNKILPTVKRKGSWYGELPLVSVRGKITPAIQNISLIRDDKGNPAYFGNAIHDISQRKNAEQALIESEKKYRNLTEAVPLGIVVTSLGGEIIEANPALIKMFRYKSREEFIKDNAFSHWLNTKINIKEFFKQLLDKNIVKGFEIQFKRKDGTIFWGNITSVKEEAGEGVRITTSLEDITDRKEAEEKLNSQYRQLLSIFDGMDEVVYVADPNTYEILYLNKTGKNNWGDCIGKKCHRFLQKLNSPCSFCSNKHIFGKNLGKTYIWEWHNMINNKWYRCIDKAINWPDGRIVRLEIAVDITERKKSEILLAASEENYRSIFNSANDAIFVHDVATGKILDVNEKVVEMYGFSAKEMHRLNVESISEGVSPYSQKEAAGWMKKASEHGPQLFEWRAKDKKGKLFWVEVNLKLVMIKNTMRILAVVRDITDRKNLEKIKAGLIRDISHGLKTPIAMTEMAISIAEEGVKLKDMNHIRKAQDIAVNNIKKMRRDVDNIMEAFTLDMRRLQENREPVKKVSLTSVMNKIKGEIKYMLDDKMIELSVDICNDADKVLIDSRDLQVLLGNIIVNAIKFTEEGKIFVVARLKDKWIEISIKDTGSGIPPEHIDRVFERFYKHHPAVDGSGLGLAICREIIEMYNGEISIQSQGVGKGTTVTVNLLNKKIK